MTHLRTLRWPVGYPRTVFRSHAKFGKHPSLGLTLHESLSRLDRQIDQFTRKGCKPRTADETLSANVEVGAHGTFKANQPEPQDPGVALYFDLDGKSIVLCCDKWNRVASNIAAIAATLEAMRGLERWGVTEVNRVFTGFAALPESATARTFWDILQIPKGTRLTQSVIDSAWRDRARVCHPDVPTGSHEAFTELNNARDQAVTTLAAQ